jgi:flavin reductase (DIM6/NTAB) family NADH-FMN oxidoreductase RutF
VTDDKDDRPAVDGAVLRAVMASYPTGVTIVTSQFEGNLVGMAANSFTSVSLDPPIVLVCCQRHARTAEAAKRSGRFAIHILAHDQVDHARAFVGRNAKRFESVPHWIDADGVPILDGWLSDAAQAAAAADDGRAGHAVGRGRRPVRLAGAGARAADQTASGIASSRRRLA